jgi:hypothetical protein
MATTLERNKSNNLGPHDTVVEDSSDTSWIGYMLLVVALLAIAWAASAFLFDNDDATYNNISYTTGANDLAPASGTADNNMAQPQYNPNQNANTVSNNPAATNEQFIAPNNPYQSANSDPELQNNIPQSGQ